MKISACQLIDADKMEKLVILFGLMILNFFV